MAYEEGGLSSPATPQGGIPSVFDPSDDAKNHWHSNRFNPLAIDLADSAAGWRSRLCLWSLGSVVGCEAVFRRRSPMRPPGP